MIVTGRVTVDSSPHLRPVLHEAITGTLERLEEVDEARQVAALCTISVQLVGTRTGAVVWSAQQPNGCPSSSATWRVVVNGLAAAVRATVERLVTDMELDLGRGAARRDVP